MDPRDHESVPTQVLDGAQQREIDEVAVPDGVDEVAGDHGQGVEELADEDAVRGQPRRVRGQHRVEVLLVHEEVHVDDEVGLAGDGDPSHTQPLEVRPPRAAVRAVQLDHRRAGAEVLSLDDSLGRGGRVPQHRLRLHRARLFQAAAPHPGPSWISKQSRQIRSSSGYARSLAGSSETKGKASDAGTSPRWTTGSTEGERQARHTSPRGAAPTVTWPPSHDPLSGRGQIPPKPDGAAG